MNGEGNTGSKKPGLAQVNVIQYFEDLRRQGEEDERANKGYVWTIQVGGTSSITVGGLASADYTLDLNCSHVGETMYGVYRGTMDFKVKGDISGVKGMLAVIGMRSSSDVDGWFKNDRFVMELKPFSPTSEEEFTSPFEAKPLVDAPESTGDATQDAANQAVYQAINDMLGKFLKPTSSDNDATCI